MNRLRFVAPWVTLIVALLVAILATAGLLILFTISEQSYRGEALLINIRSLAYQLSAAEWQAIAEADLASEVAEAEQVVAAGRAEIAQALEALQQLDTDDRELLRHVQTTTDEYLDALELELFNIQRGEIARARQIDAERVDPTFAHLESLLRTSEASYRARAARVRLTANLLAALVIITAGLIIGRLFVLNQRAQARAELAAAEQAALQQSEARFRALVQNAWDVILILKPDGKISYASVSSQRILELPAESLVGANLLSLVHEADTDALRALLAYCLHRQTGMAGTEIRLRHRIGLWRAFEVLGSGQLDNPSVEGIVLNLHDVTERREAADKLRETNEQQARWLASLQQRSHEINLLHELGDLLQSCLTVEEAHEVIAQSAQKLFPDQSGALYVFKASRNQIEAAIGWGTAPPAASSFAPSDCWAVRRGQPYLAHGADAGLFCRHVSEERLPAASLCVPLVAQGDTLGVLHLQTPAGASDSLAALADAQQNLARAAADSCALALANLHLRDSLRQQSIRDPLTGLYNRRYMEETMERELRRAIRNQRALGIIMLDLDHFKEFNDTCGHEAGDVLLRELGAFLQAHIRAEDIACRYGGDELTLILPEASLEATFERAESLRNGIRHYPIQHRGQLLGPLTLSLGVSGYPRHGSTGEALLSAADAALYRAKREGRDQTVIAE